jgi:AraC-like DNA-binding protein
VKKKNSVISNAEEKNGNRLNLKFLEEKIITNKINSVEALANYLETNTVQLNRNFREFHLTPGKFLKKVKLNHAKQLLKDGKTLEEVANNVGYSVKFLKNELGESN